MAADRNAGEVCGWSDRLGGSEKDKLRQADTDGEGGGGNLGRKRNGRQKRGGTRKADWDREGRGERFSEKERTGREDRGGEKELGTDRWGTDKTDGLGGHRPVG